MRLESTRKSLSSFGRTTVRPGVNEVSDEDFYSLMRLKHFQAWVVDGTFKVLDGFDIYKAPVLVKEEVIVKEEKSAPVEAEEEVSQKNNGLSAKQTLKLIDESDHLEFLETLLSDSRDKIVNAAKDKIEKLKEVK